MLIQQAPILLNVKLCGITHKQIHIHWCLSLTQEGGGHRSPSEGLSGSARQSVRPSPCWRLAPSLSAFNCLFNGLSSSTVALLWELDCSLASAFLADTLHQSDRSRASKPTTSLFIVITGSRFNRYIQLWMEGEFCIYRIPSHWKMLIWPLFTIIKLSAHVSNASFPLPRYCKLQFTHFIMSTYAIALQSHQTMRVDVKFTQNSALSSQWNVIGKSRYEYVIFWVQYTSINVIEYLQWK